ncbi:MAG: chemotaxis protein CheD [Geobacteraceae bacterium]|nr:chemotaxis protein CheD [Geobacteraceae bacterium]
MSNHHHEHLPHIFLKPGELFLSREPAIVSTVLGSCVSITIFDPSTTLGAMCHVMLPSGPLDNGFKFVDSTLGYMVAKINAMGIRLAACEVKMFGGADVLLPREGQGDRLSVGRQNVLQTQHRLVALGIVLKASDVGGRYGRKLLFHSHTGDVFLKKLGNSNC